MCNSDSMWGTSFSVRECATGSLECQLSLASVFRVRVAAMSRQVQPGLGKFLDCWTNWTGGIDLEEKREWEAVKCFSKLTGGSLYCIFTLAKGPLTFKHIKTKYGHTLSKVNPAKVQKLWVYGTLAFPIFHLLYISIC